MLRTLNAHRYIAEALHQYGVSHVFFVPTILIPALAEMDELGITGVMAHDEKSAAYMADGFARASGRPGVCMAQTAGAANTAAGLQDAYLASSPVVAITGGRLPGTKYRHEYQEIAALSMFGPVTKFNVEVDNASRLPDLLRQAFRSATTGTPAPVHLEVPGASGVTLGELSLDEHQIAEPQFGRYPAFRSEPSSESVVSAIELLRSSRRPVIVAGGGVKASGAQAELVEFAERMSIPVATSLNAKGTISESHPLSLGICGLYCRRSANQAINEADLIFYIGSKTGAQVTNTWKTPAIGACKVIQCDIEPEELSRNYPNDVSLLGDAKTVLRHLIEVSGKGERTEWLSRVNSLTNAWREAKGEVLSSDATPIRPERLCKEIEIFLPPDGILVSETGHAAMWTGTMVEMQPGQTYIRAAGTMGWAFSGAIGAKCGQPDRPVVCFTGDGAFYNHIAELETARRYGIKLVVVVNNNSAMSQEMGLFETAYKGAMTEAGRKMWAYEPINFARVAESFGCAGFRVERPDEIAEALRKAAVSDLPAVVDVVTDLHVLADPA